MSKKSINKAKQRRLQEKRGRREANQRRYEAYAASGTNTKSKRSRRNSKANKGIAQRDISCRNIGDSQQNWSLNLPFLVQTYLLYRDGVPNQWTGSNPTRVRNFVERHELSIVNNKVRQYGRLMTPERIRALV